MCVLKTLTILTWLTLGVFLTTAAHQTSARSTHAATFACFCKLLSGTDLTKHNLQNTQAQFKLTLIITCIL